ncbi:MAG: thioredoxin domain-containing protein [Deltaproteobacteria bacterium]|nr:thioredoxin domain-containing protein [Candidatus Zymogenaceae bacterium]
MTNLLAREKSPYLRQHAENPVDWRPWGDEAFQQARAEDKPVFLSIGYSSCHWCHVMARESFSDDEVAAILNERFIAVKVDREERPDVDALYMAACQVLGQPSGWPLSVFLTPSGRPFFAGTYFPKQARGAMPGLIEVLEAVSRMWAADRARIDTTGDRVTEILRQEASVAGDASPIGPEVSDKAFSSLRGRFDERYGGFGEAPKFPMPHRLSFLLRYHRAPGNARALEMVRETLRGMRYGGIFDQIGLGFHRYSVDERWRVPHFEKMLSDQALCASAYIEAFLVTGDPLYDRTAREIFTYVLRDMTADEGGFFTAEDAESDSEEGVYYLWTRDEIQRLLGTADADLAADYFGIKREGNIPVPGFMDGMNIPYVPVGPELFADRRGMETERLLGYIESFRERLLTAREMRPRPKRDDKVVTATNGLMVGALAMGYRALGERMYLDAAVSAVGFVSEKLSDGSSGLLRRYREGEAGIGGFLEDYAFFVWGLIELYEACLDIQYLEQAGELSRVMVERFDDRKNGGLFTTPRDGQRLIADLKEVYDGAAPCPNSVAADNLLRLYGLTGNIDFSRAADRILGAFSRRIAAHPDAGTRFLDALERSGGSAREIVIVGQRESESTRKMIGMIHRLFLPTTSLLFVPDGDAEGRRRVERIVPFVTGMRAQGRRTTAYICRGHTCRAPLVDPESVREALVEQR